MIKTYFLLVVWNIQRDLVIQAILLWSTKCVTWSFESLVEVHLVLQLYFLDGVSIQHYPLGKLSGSDKNWRQPSCTKEKLLETTFLFFFIHCLLFLYQKRNAKTIKYIKTSKKEELITTLKNQSGAMNVKCKKKRLSNEWYMITMIIDFLFPLSRSENIKQIRKIELLPHLKARTFHILQSFSEFTNNTPKKKLTTVLTYFVCSKTCTLLPFEARLID